MEVKWFLADRCELKVGDVTMESSGDVYRGAKALELLELTNSLEKKGILLAARRPTASDVLCHQDTSQTVYELRL